MINKTVFWSGGLDSTYLIYKLLCDGFHVDAYYIKLENNKNKTKRELNAIQHILPLFKKYNFTYKGILSTVAIEQVEDNTTIFHQSPIWIMLSLFVKGPLSIGYVMNDDAISYLDDYRKIITDLNVLRDSPLEIEFPLQKFKKETIIKLLPKEYLKHIVYCESEKKSKCGVCHPCLRFKEALSNNKRN